MQSSDTLDLPILKTLGQDPMQPNEKKRGLSNPAPTIKEKKTA